MRTHLPRTCGHTYLGHEDTSYLAHADSAYLEQAINSQQTERQITNASHTKPAGHTRQVMQRHPLQFCVQAFVIVRRCGNCRRPFRMPLPLPLPLPLASASRICGKLSSVAESSMIRRDFLKRV